MAKNEPRREQLHRPRRMIDEGLQRVIERPPHVVIESRCRPSRVLLELWVLVLGQVRGHGSPPPAAKPMPVTGPKTHRRDQRPRDPPPRKTRQENPPARGTAP